MPNKKLTDLIEIPEIIYPIGGSRYNSTTLDVEWKAEPYNDKFQIQLSKDLSFNNLIVDTVLEDLSHTYTYNYTLEDLNENEEYFIKVRTIEGNKSDGNFSRWSGIVNFSTKVEEKEIDEDKPTEPEEPKPREEGDEEEDIPEDVSMETKEFEVGYNLDILSNNKLKFQLEFIPINTFTIDNIDNVKGTNTTSVISKYPLKYGSWNYINFGITDNKELFLQIVNEDHNINDNDIQLSEEIIGISIEELIYNVIGKYPNVSLLNTANIENFYYSFPTIMIGGLENNDVNSKLYQSTSFEQLPGSIKDLTELDNVDRGFVDFEISSFRYYNKQLSSFEKEEEMKVENLDSTDLTLQDNCYIDLQFNEIDENKIQDLSNNGNHGIVFGDMKLDIYDDGNDYKVIEQDLPKIKNNKGPF